MDHWLALARNYHQIITIKKASSTINITSLMVVTIPGNKAGKNSLLINKYLDYQETTVQNIEWYR